MVVDSRNEMVVGANVLSPVSSAVSPRIAYNLFGLYCLVVVAMDTGSGAFEIA